VTNLSTKNFYPRILANAVSVFGTEEAAKHWMARPAMGVNQQRPIDLLATPAGVEMVETFLERLRYGVYT
jgi:putative toxin-antitoxin system antitoxin component (TIGR02293 family)